MLQRAFTRLVYKNPAGSILALRNTMQPMSKRMFSTEIQAVTQATGPLERISSKGVSAALFNEDAALAAKNQEYYDTLNNVDGRSKLMQALAEDDNSEISKTKKMINKLIERELGELAFQDKLTAEERLALESDVQKEVITNSNFFFAYDSNKLDKNLKVHDFKAPGNTFRHPNVILPHEHTDVQHFLKTSDLTDDKLFKMYGYYSLLVDLHIAQIRPGIIDEKRYVPPYMNQVAGEWLEDENLNNMFFDHYHRWREPTSEKLATHIKWQEAMDARPMTDHYDHDKGTPYDVEWTEDQKFPHVATRLGFPILREEPLERMLGFETAMANPGYQFQPFVQVPAMEPDAALNFEEGDVIYENARVGEWIKFWKASFIVLFGLSPGFYMFEFYQGDGAPSLQWMSDNWNWFQVPMQFQDGSGWGTKGIRYCDDHDYMNLVYGVKRSIIRPSHTAFVGCAFTALYFLDFNYVTKMRYNKDKDLVFVTKPNQLWGETEKVHEVHHLEQMVPSPVTAIKNMSVMDPRGILTVQDMGTKDLLKFYHEDKYWNVDLKDEFKSETRSLWEGTHDDKYHGRLFSTTYQGSKHNHFQLQVERVDAEMDAAIAKHGNVTVPKHHMEEFYDRIEQEKQAIVQGAK